MFLKLFVTKKEVQNLAKEIATETSEQLKTNYQNHENKLDQITEVLHMLTNKVVDLEKKLQTKEIRDHQTYGHLTYKISEVSSDLSSELKKNNN